MASVETELLCNVDEALTTPTGLTMKNPCGSIIGLCSYNDFTQWLAAYKVRLTIALRNFDYLKNLRIKAFDAKLLPDGSARGLREDQQVVLEKVKDLEADYDSRRMGVAKDLDSDTYETQISAIIVNASEVNCIIEQTIQEGIVELGMTPPPTGLIKGSRTKMQWWEIVAWGSGGLLAIWIIKGIVKE